MLKIFILIAFSFNLAFAKSRFTDSDKQKFLEEVKQGIAAHKIDNKGKVDFQIIKPDLYEELDVYYKQEKFTREELIKIKQKYEEFSKSGIAPENAEGEFYKFVKTQLDEINKTEVVKIKEGKICNSWSCEDGLKCAPDPKQDDGPSCKKEGRECKEDGDCCSTSCTLNTKSKKRFCEVAYKCFRPVKLGGSCNNNPICGEGECLLFNSKTSGIGECEDNSKFCKKNTDCCSNSCEANKCVESYICKDCIKNGKKPNRGQKCCEGLYINSGGVCVPDVPPTVIPQVNIKSQLMNYIASLFMSSAEAATEISDEEAALREQEFLTKINAKSSSRADIEAALKIYDETDADIKQLQDLATRSDKYKQIYDEELKKQTEEDAAEIARTQAIKIDNSDMTKTIKDNKGDYEKFEAKSEAADIVDIKTKTPAMDFTRKSDFSTCDIRFRDDFTNYLKEADLMDPEIALLSFDYMFLGKGVNDYWKTDLKKEDTSIYGRLHSIAVAHQKVRTDNNKKIDDINHKLTCMCLDALGYSNIKDQAKKTFFEKECEEYKIEQTGEVCSRLVSCTAEVFSKNSCQPGPADAPLSSLKMVESCSKGEEGCTCETSFISSISNETASGIKGKKLLVNWTKNLQLFNASLVIDNSGVFNDLLAMSQWSASDAAGWNNAESKEVELFNYHVKNPSLPVAVLGGFIGALLAAGVIAVLGGFASASILTAWASFWIISTSALTAGTGLWLIASLKGAWISKRPEITDTFVRSYSCGKKERCEEYSRKLYQPFNNICNTHTSANACVKNFVVYYENNNQPRYVVDPWIPLGVSKSLVLRDIHDKRDYAEKMEDGYEAAKKLMKNEKNPHSTGGEGKSGGSFVSDNYKNTLFIDADVLRTYTPNIKQDEHHYTLNDSIINLIKAKAKDYAVGQKFFLEGDTDNLNKFANYTYKYHFLWPKTSKDKEISYPTIGLTTYLEFMSNGVVGKLSTGAGKAAISFGNLNTKYLEDYLRTLQLYSDQAVNQTDGQLKSTKDEINKTQLELDNLRVLNALATNTSLDSQLLNLNPNLVNSTAKSIGTSGTVSLSANQSAFLNAIGKLRIARKTQLKNLDLYNKAIASDGNKDRAFKIASASKSFSARFSHPITGNGGSLDSVGSGALGPDSKKPDAIKNISNFESGNYNTYGSDPGGRSSSTVNSKPGTDNKNMKGESSGVSDEDSRRLAEAIEARNKTNKDKYKSNEEQSIFEKVTNAYIRNYDKVLTKKKDKDIVEQ